MTPQEIFEYKKRWSSTAVGQYIDPDADIWAKDWCRRNLQRHQWTFNKFARQDDWHHISFENPQDYIEFSKAYDNR